MIYLPIVFSIFKDIVFLGGSSVYGAMLFLEKSFPAFLVFELQIFSIQVTNIAAQPSPRVSYVIFLGEKSRAKNDNLNFDTNKIAEQYDGNFFKSSAIFMLFEA